MKVAAHLFFFFGKRADVPVNKDPVATLQYLLGPLPQLKVSGHLLSVQLMSTNAYLHTSIMYGQWEGWDGKPSISHLCSTMELPRQLPTFFLVCPMRL